MPSIPGLTVRPVEWGDFDDIRDMYYQLYDERAAGELVGITLFDRRPSIPDEVTWFSAHYRHAMEGDEIYVVAEWAGHVVGSCTITRDGPGPGSEESHVGRLGILVDRNHRGKGVGTALLESALGAARSKFDVVYLTVFSVNERALHLYRRFGFAVCGHLPAVVKRGDRYYDEEQMVLDFRPSSVRAGANR